MVNMVLQDAQPMVVIVSSNFFSNVKEAGVSVLELKPDWEDSLLSQAEAAAVFVPPVMVGLHQCTGIFWRCRLPVCEPNSNL